MNDIVGTVTNPLANSYGNFDTGGAGIVLLFSNILRLVFLAGGVYALINFIVGGYMWMNAGGDAKAVTTAWNKIWQTLLGLAIMVSSFALAALFGQIIFGDPGFILNPKIYGPGN